MAISLKHKFVSAKADPADTTLVKPSNWNDEHDLTGSANTLAGFDGAGALTEVAQSAFAASGHSHSGLAPAGGTAGQVLKKTTGTDYDYAWATDATGSGGTGLPSVTSRAGLKAASVTAPVVAFDGSLWDLVPYASYSAKVTADTYEGIYARSTDDVTQVRRRLYGGPVAATWFQFTADLAGTSGTDDAAHFSAMIAALDNGDTVDFGSLQIYYASNITVNKDLNFIGLGARFYGNAAYIAVTGTLTTLGSIVSGANTKGALTLNVTSTAGIAADDHLIIHNQVNYSFAPHRTYYQDGEWVYVRSVGSGVLNLGNRLRTSYTGAATDKVFKVNPRLFTTEGISYEGTGSSALRLDVCVTPIISGDVIGGTDNALSLNQCHAAVIKAGKYFHTAAASGDNYGISIANCDGVTVDPLVEVIGTRHAIATGGSSGDGCVPCRDIKVSGAKLTNLTVDLACADFHGNTSDSYYEDCDLNGTVALGGYNVAARGNRVISWHTVAPVTLTEVVGGLIDVSGNQITFISSSTATRVMGVASSSQFGLCAQNYNLRFNNNTIALNSAVTSVVFHFHNCIGTVKWSYEMQGTTLTGTVSGLTTINDLQVNNSLAWGTAPISAWKLDIGTIQSLSALATLVTLTSLTGTWTTGYTAPLNPIASDATSLGTSLLPWSDLFIATGGVVTMGNVTLTQSSGTLTYGGLSLLAMGLGPSTPGNFGVSSYGYFGSLYSSGAIALGYNAKADAAPNNQLVVANTNASAGYCFHKQDSLGHQFHAVAGSVTAGAVASNEVIRITPTAIRPGTNDGASLGISGTAFSDLFGATGFVFNLGNGNMTGTHSADTLTWAGGGHVWAAGTTTYAPVKFTSGTNLTTAAAGAQEFDGSCFYATAAASSRQVTRNEQFITLTSAYTLTSQTAAQKLFNATTNGTITVQANTTYYFECEFDLSSMSATSGSFGFALGGTATISAQKWTAVAQKAAAIGTAATAQITVNTAANTTLATASTTTTGSCFIKGKIRVTTAGTIIPQVSLGVAAAAIVGVDASFCIWAEGSNTVTNVGNWS